MLSPAVPYQLPNWLAGPVASLGGLGIFLVAFLDSSVLSFPILNDLLVIHLSIQTPARMPWYALMATAGSVSGCVVLYYIARKGGEVWFRKRAGARAAQARQWVERNGFLATAIPAILPPPMPFKVFVLAAGVFQVPLRTFVLALLLARGLRYFAEGFLAVRYGAPAAAWLLTHKLEFSALALALILLSYLLSRLLLRPRLPSST